MYYLLLDGAQTGPYTLAQLIDMWREQRIGPLTFYWEEGNADWLPLHNIAPLLEVPARSPAPPTLPNVLATPANPPASGGGEESIWTGHPSLWNWTGSLFWVLILLVVPAPAAIGFAIFGRHVGLFWLMVIGPVILGILILIHVLWSRNTTRYTVTKRRVSVQTGIFNRSSRELRIGDIRSIGARANIFGIGDVEFSTAAREEAEVVFWSLTRVERVRDLVKKLQNEQD